MNDYSGKKYTDMYTELKRYDLMNLATEKATEMLLKPVSHYAPVRKHQNMGTFG